MASRKSNSARVSSNIKPLKSAPKATTVRNSAIPKAIPAASRTRSAAVAPAAQITFEMVQRRAYEISQSPFCGSEFDNWVRAERELRGQ